MRLLLRRYGGGLDVQGVQLLDAAPADRHRGVGQPHGRSPPGPAGAAAGGVVLRPLLAGKGGATAGPVAHRLGHAQLAVGDLAGELVVLGEVRKGRRSQTSRSLVFTFNDTLSPKQMLGLGVILTAADCELYLEKQHSGRGYL